MIIKNKQLIEKTDFVVKLVGSKLMVVKDRFGSNTDKEINSETLVNILNNDVNLQSILLIK